MQQVERDRRRSLARGVGEEDDGAWRGDRVEPARVEALGLRPTADFARKGHTAQGCHQTAARRQEREPRAYY